MLKGKKILLGVTGSIAAYKAGFLVRLLVQQGAQVRVVMTPAAKDFVTPLTLSTLSKNPVYSEFTHGDQGEWNNHVHLALWADLFLVAPATAETMAKIAGGHCDNLLLAVYLSSKCPVLLAPAMDLDMYRHPATKENMKKLVQNGNVIIPAEKGELASGLTGEGRMAEPENILTFIENYLSKNAPLSGKKALVTAGPTYEAIDPVRFIGNHSSGKMGIAVAEALASAGADVTLIAGPSAVESSDLIGRINVVSAEEMRKACLKESKKADIIVMAAAVADFRPSKISRQKIKKEKGLGSIQLESTPDILSELGSNKKYFLAGFALETENGEENARKKLRNKNLDLIVLNAPTAQTGFGHETNKITIIDKKSKTESGLVSKQEAARMLVETIVRKIK